MNVRLALVALLACVLLATAASAKRRIFVYSGKLLDERSAPVGGVFPLTFAFYTKSKGGQAVWSESHYVAVDNGVYQLELGRRKAIPGSISLDELYVGVKITGGPEIVRERFIAEGSEEEVIREKGIQDTAKAATGGTVDYAEKAGFAYVAEKADNSTRLDGLTLDQVKRAVAAEGGGGGGGGGVHIGENTFNSPTAGGDGGTPFQHLCPDGYVMTGVRGAAGLYLDRIGVICSPLESGGKGAHKAPAEGP